MKNTKNVELFEHLHYQSVNLCIIKSITKNISRTSKLLQPHQQNHQNDYEYEQNHQRNQKQQQLPLPQQSKNEKNNVQISTEVKHVKNVSSPVPVFVHWRKMIILFVLLFLNLIQITYADWLLDCGDCSCKWNSGKKTAYCQNLSLSAIPENLSPEVQVLDLSYNHISFLEENAFVSAQLYNIQKLYMRNSSVQQVDPRTFNQLEILIEVDLSNNLLRTLKPNLFSRLSKLRYVILSGNLLETLGDGIFQSLKFLHKIELQNNRLKQISTKTFIDLPLLSHIYLENNRLTHLRKETFENLPKLSALSLEQNPWNCTCELQMFRDFVIKHNLYTPPTACFYPATLKGMLWIDNQDEAFACTPQIIYPTNGAMISTSKENITLICRVHSSAKTQINWEFNNKHIIRANSLSSRGDRFQIQLLRDVDAKEKDFGREIFITRLTIFHAEDHDEGIYSCTAENTAGKAVVEMSLTVQTPNDNFFNSQDSFFVLMCLVVLSFVAFASLMAVATYYTFKHFKRNGESEDNLDISLEEMQQSPQLQTQQNHLQPPNQNHIQNQKSRNVVPTPTQVYYGNDTSFYVNAISHHPQSKKHHTQQPKQTQRLHDDNSYQHPQYQPQYYFTQFQEGRQQQQQQQHFTIANRMAEIDSINSERQAFHQPDKHANETQRTHADDMDMEESNQGKIHNTFPPFIS